MELNFRWVKKTGNYQTGKQLYLNKIKVASYGWNPVRSISDGSGNDSWYGLTYLPQMETRVYDGDESEIKVKLERNVTAWFVEASELAKEVSNG